MTGPPAELQEPPDALLQVLLPVRPFMFLVVFFFVVTHRFRRSTRKRRGGAHTTAASAFICTMMLFLTMSFMLFFLNLTTFFQLFGSRFADRFFFVFHSATLGCFMLVFRHKMLLKISG